MMWTQIKQNKPFTVCRWISVLSKVRLVDYVIAAESECDSVIVSPYLYLDSVDQLRNEGLLILGSYIGPHLFWKTLLG